MHEAIFSILAKSSFLGTFYFLFCYWQVVHLFMVHCLATHLEDSNLQGWTRCCSEVTDVTHDNSEQEGQVWYSRCRRVRECGWRNCERSGIHPRGRVPKAEAEQLAFKDRQSMGADREKFGYTATLPFLLFYFTAWWWLLSLRWDSVPGGRPCHLAEMHAWITKSQW